MEGQAEKQPTEPQTLNDLASLVGDYESGDAVDVGDQSTEEEQGEELAEEAGEEVDESEEDEPESDETTTITHDGKEVKLTKAEALELAQKGFDYTKKTQVLADERKEVEQRKTLYAERVKQQEQALEETLYRLNTAADFLESELGAPPSIELAQYDAASYIAQKETYESRVAKLKNTYGQIQQLSHEQQRLSQVAIEEQANETEKYLIEHLPGWKDDPAKSLKEMNEYINGYGLKPETVKEAYVQKGLWEIAHKAREYDRIIAKRAELKPAKASPPRTIKPSSNPVPANVKHTEAMKRHRAQPSLKTLAAMFESI